MKTSKIALLSTALLAIAATPAFAAEAKKTKEIKELVGYNVTVSRSHDPLKLKAFNRIDTNANSYIDAKELKYGSNLDDSYSIFLRMDTNKDKKVNIEEFSSFNKTKGNTHVESQLHGKTAVKGTNLKSRQVIETKTYYEPTEREIVEIKNIEPAAE